MKTKGYPQKEIDKAIDFAKKIQFRATISKLDNRSIDFHQTMEVPQDMDPEVKSLLEIAIQYFQRSIFTGEYLMADEEPPVRKSGEPIDDINFYLGYYKPKLVDELKKAYELDDDLNPVRSGPKLTPFAESILAYRKEMAGKIKKEKAKQKDN